MSDDKKIQFERSDPDGIGQLKDEIADLRAQLALAQQTPVVPPAQPETRGSRGGIAFATIAIASVGIVLHILQSPESEPVAAEPQPQVQAAKPADNPDPESAMERAREQLAIASKEGEEVLTALLCQTAKEFYREANDQSAETGIAPGHSRTPEAALMAKHSFLLSQLSQAQEQYGQFSGQGDRRTTLAIALIPLVATHNAMMIQTHPSRQQKIEMVAAMEACPDLNVAGYLDRLDGIEELLIRAEARNPYYDRIPERPAPTQTVPTSEANANGWQPFGD